MKLSPFEAAKPIIQRFISHGYEAYFVGGAVRDFIMGRDIHDVDITTNATPDEIEALFEHTIPVGKEHGTINVVWDQENYEITTFRAEAEYVDHRRPTEVYFVRDLYQDVERRDFTMNAIAMDMHYHRLDYFDGERDIHQRLIRTVGDAVTRFDEDALRILRGLRFKAQLGFDIDADTFNAMQLRIADVQYLSIERIINELRLLVKGAFVTETLPLLHQLNIWQYLPVFSTMDVPSIRLNAPVTLESFLALLGYQFNPSSWKSLKLSNAQLKTIQQLIDAIEQVQTISSKEELRFFVYSFGIEISLKLVELRETFALNQISIPSTLIFNAPLINEIWNHLPIHQRQDLAINGKRLMQTFQLSGGPWIKEVLSQVERAVIEARLHNDTEAIIEWVKTNVKIS